MNIRILFTGLRQHIVTNHSPWIRLSFEGCGKFFTHTKHGPLYSTQSGASVCRSTSAFETHKLALKSRLFPHQATCLHIPSVGLRTIASVFTTTRCYSQDVVVKPKHKVRGIQKDVSPLTTRRILRRKKTVDSPATDKFVYDGVAYATAEEINLESLKVDLEIQGLYSLCALPKDVTDALYVEAIYKVDDERREMFFFREGSVVFWNMPEEERRTVLQLLRRHQQDSYDNLLIEQNFEKVDFTYIDTPSTLAGDEIQLQRVELTGDENHLQLEKYTFSNALSLSVKLSIWEASLERYVDSIEWLLQDLKDGKKIKMSREDVLRKTGELFTLRHLINLSSDLLDTPDFYWDREPLEQLYTKTVTHLNISRRTKVMNEKLTYCSELVELVREHLNDKHHTRLEWMIIILILIEVLFEIFHIIERHS